MPYIGWVKDTRLQSFGQKAYYTSSNFVFETKKEAQDAARRILINDKQIFEFVWNFMDGNDYEEFEKVFPEIYAFRDFRERFPECEQGDEFEDELVDLSIFNKFVKLYPFLEYGYCKAEDFEDFKKV
mgnify:CR=1 FL=1|tara:strand:- start:262 stop:642 length:381 start_codon:yes stop_codon:yes gene_type:complete